MKNGLTSSVRKLHDTMNILGVVFTIIPLHSFKKSCHYCCINQNARRRKSVLFLVKSYFFEVLFEHLQKLILRLNTIETFDSKARQNHINHNRLTIMSDFGLLR